VYCLCSDESHDSIMDKQRLKPLPFELMIATYTRCSEGCGSCIEELRQRFDAEFPSMHSPTSTEVA
jgi:NAD(P)H-nitrite reductase large subunit